MPILKRERSTVAKLVQLPRPRAAIKDLQPKKWGRETFELLARADEASRSSFLYCYS